jgi:hypothetical protein
MRVNPWVVCLRSLALGVSTCALLGCGSSELGTIKVPEDMRRKPTAALGQGTCGRDDS